MKLRHRSPKVKHFEYDPRLKLLVLNLLIESEADKNAVSPKLKSWAEGYLEECERFEESLHNNRRRAA